MTEDSIITLLRTPKGETNTEEREQATMADTKSWYEVRFYFELPMTGTWFCEADSAEEARELFEKCETKDELIELHEYREAFQELCDVRMPPESVEVIGPQS